MVQIIFFCTVISLTKEPCIRRLHIHTVVYHGDYNKSDNLNLLIAYSIPYTVYLPVGFWYLLSQKLLNILLYRV